MSQDTAKVLQRTPGPDGRSWSHAQAGFKGVEGEIAHDPVTPGVVWAGGVQGGSRINGERNCKRQHARRQSSVDAPSFAFSAVTSTDLAFHRAHSQTALMHPPPVRRGSKLPSGAHEWRRRGESTGKHGVQSLQPASDKGAPARARPRRHQPKKVFEAAGHPVQASYANLEKTSGVPLSHLFAKSLNRAPVSRLDPNWCAQAANVSWPLTQRPREEAWRQGGPGPTRNLLFGPGRVLQSLRPASAPPPHRSAMYCRKDPVEEVGGDVRRMRDLTFHDLQQCGVASQPQLPTRAVVTACPLRPAAPCPARACLEVVERVRDCFASGGRRRAVAIKVSFIAAGVAASSRPPDDQV